MTKKYMKFADDEQHGNNKLLDDPKCPRRVRAREYVRMWEESDDDPAMWEKTKRVAKIPTAAAMAMHMGVSKCSLLNWAAKDEEIAELYDSMLCMQEILTVNHGLSGEFQHHIAKIILGNHGYSEKTESTNTLQGPDGGPIQTESVDVSALSVAALEELANLRRNTGE